MIILITSIKLSSLPTTSILKVLEKFNIFRQKQE